MGAESLWEYQWFQHPLYVDPITPNNKEYNDIGLIKLESNFSDLRTDGRHYVINTICLPNKNAENLNKENTTFFGYGLMNANIYMGPNLQKAEFNKNSYEDCDPKLCLNFTNARICNVCLHLQ